MAKALIPASLDPITSGHVALITQCARAFDEVIVAIGDNADKKPVFSPEDRIAMTQDALQGLLNVKVMYYRQKLLAHYVREIGADFVVRGIRDDTDFRGERALNYGSTKINPEIRFFYVITDKSLSEVSSSFVRGIASGQYEGWKTVVSEYVTPFVLWHLSRHYGGDKGVPRYSDWAEAEARSRWRSSFQAAHGEIDLVFDRLLHAYNTPPRPYHNFGHLRHCFTELQSFAREEKISPSIELAIWFHDAIYDAKRSDNEEASAELASTELKKLGVPEEEIAAIKTLILATKHKSPPATLEEQILTDIDLSILGQTATEFDAYEEAVRLEYGHVAEAAFWDGRAKFLRTMLDKENLFHTPYFKAKYGAAAVRNMQRSIDRTRK